MSRKSAPQVPAKDLPRPAFAAPARPTEAPERKLMVPAQLRVLLEMHLDKVLVEGAAALDGRTEMPDWSLEPCRPGEMIEITMRRVLPVTQPRASRAWEEPATKSQKDDDQLDLSEDEDSEG